MLKSSVLKIIQSFSKEEISEFNDFLKSPYFNKKSGVVKLYNEIKKYYPDFTNENLDKEKLWGKLYPGKKYGYGVMKNLINDFTKLAEEFIKNQDYKTNEIQGYTNLMNAFALRNLKNLLDNKISFFNNKFNDKSIKDLKNITSDEYFWYLSKIYGIKIFNSHFHDQHCSLDEDIKKLQSTFMTGMIIHSISINYLVYTSSFNDKTRSSTTNFVRNFMKSIPVKAIEEVLKSVKNESEIKFKILKCYYLGYKASINLNNSGYYINFKKYFFSNYQIMPFLFKRDLDVFLVNTIVLMTDKSFDKEKEKNDLRRFKLKNNLILDQNGYMNGVLFIPAVITFFEENKIDELADFVKDYKKYLIGEDKAASLMFADAIIFLAEAEFSKSINLMTKIKFKSFFLKNILKKFTLIVQYEINDYEMFVNIRDAYKHFLDYSDWGDQEIKDFWIKSAKDFCNCLDKMFMLKDSKDINEIILLKKEIIENNSDLKKWFLRKLDKINKSQAKLSA